uniref:Ribosomal protein S20 n=2 Tax=Gracilariopsis TaxID=2781 RepID=A0A1C9CEX2_9FLOR|nr:ribosomal protein S20 [Gracilariopsis lemaneiformis]YP_009294634.1 ribosomal protein S20 [Gracilariopsis chorda]AJO68475.1 ribosomal protein S20 [Gracilariopsis lemaneiformis]AML79918.1 ribosomal protein S20 [Gracilariopsis lemaneiformis]AOM66894.1 ribosomal protein S20 [Gracilariopsis chorda]
MSKNVSVIKKMQVSLRNRRKNRSYKSEIKTLTKKYILSLNNTGRLDFKDILLQLSAIYQKIDKAISKGVLHKNNGSRKKAMLAKAMKDLKLNST